MTFLGFVLKNLTRRLFRTLLTLIALATAIGSVMALSGVADGFTDSFRQVYQSHRIDVVVTRQGSADRLSSSLEEEFVPQVTSQPGVQAAAGVLLETLSLESQQIYGVPAMGIETDSWLFDDFDMVATTGGSPGGSPGGSTEPATADSAAGGTDDRSGLGPPDSDRRAAVYLGQNLADRAGLTLGDDVSLFEEPFQVAGIFRSGSVWENGSMILPLPELQRLTGREGQVTYINVTVQEDIGQDEMDRVVQAIEQADPKLLALATDEFVESDTRMQLASGMAWMTSVIALVVGAIGTLNTMMTSILERTTEIGILRAIGWPRRRVGFAIFLESIFLAAAATLVGGLGASAMLAVLAQSSATAGLLQPTLTLPVWIRGAWIGLGIGILGALLPAYRAMGMHPTEALRQAH